MKQFVQMQHICRTGWCEHCAKEKRPRTGQQYVAVGSNGHVHVYEAQRVPPYDGFTPHLYGIYKKLGENLIVLALCTMEDCGMHNIYYDSTNRMYKFTIDESRIKRIVMSISDWNSLVLYKRDDDYVI